MRLKTDCQGPAVRPVRKGSGWPFRKPDRENGGNPGVRAVFFSERHFFANKCLTVCRGGSYKAPPVAERTTEWGAAAGIEVSGMVRDFGLGETPIAL